MRPSILTDGGIYVGHEQIRPLYERVVKDSLVKVDSVHTFVNGEWICKGDDSGMGTFRESKLAQEPPAP